jgi:hypothetical protein
MTEIMTMDQIDNQHKHHHPEQERDAVERYRDEFVDLDDHVADVVSNLKNDELLDLPPAITRDLEDVDIILTRVRYWLEDQLHALTA